MLSQPHDLWIFQWGAPKYFYKFLENLYDYKKEINLIRVGLTLIEGAPANLFIKRCVMTTNHNLHKVLCNSLWQCSFGIVHKGLWIEWIVDHILITYLCSFSESQGRMAVTHIYYCCTYGTESKKASTSHSLPALNRSSLFQQTVVSMGAVCPRNSLITYYAHFIQSHWEVYAVWSICRVIVT